MSTQTDDACLFSGEAAIDGLAEPVEESDDVGGHLPCDFYKPQVPCADAGYPFHVCIQPGNHACA